MDPAHVLGPGVAVELAGVQVNRHLFVRGIKVDPAHIAAPGPFVGGVNTACGVGHSADQPSQEQDPQQHRLEFVSSDFVRHRIKASHFPLRTGNTDLSTDLGSTSQELARYKIFLDMPAFIFVRHISRKIQ